MGNFISAKCAKPKETCDGLRDTPLRLLGYASHLGNICCKIISPNYASVPEMITTAYVTSDVFNKAMESSNAFKPRKRVAIDTFDAIIWQALASIIIPGLIINQLRNFTFAATQPSTNPCKAHPPLVKALPAPALRALPCIVGLLAIPLISYPVDYGVTKFMDLTYRAIFSEEEKKEPPKKALANKAPPKKVAEKKVVEKKVVEKKVVEKKVAEKKVA